MSQNHQRLCFDFVMIFDIICAFVNIGVTKFELVTLVNMDKRAPQRKTNSFGLSTCVRPFCDSLSNVSESATERSLLPLRTVRSVFRNKPWRVCAWPSRFHYCLLSFKRNTMMVETERVLNRSQTKEFVN